MGVQTGTTLASLDAVVERLVQEYAPDRIILFGSHATGSARPESDIDLLVVKDTARRPIDRRVEVERLLADRSIPLDLVVYTPRELRELYAAGDPFVETIVETGKVVYMRKTTAAWMAEARDELETARILLDHGKHRGVCLHSQQCAEKVLKALILERGGRPARTHDIIELLRAVQAEGWRVELSVDEAVFLNSVYRGRYPTEAGLLPHGEPDADDAIRVCRAAEAVMHQADALLQGTAG